MNKILRPHVTSQGKCTKHTQIRLNWLLKCQTESKAKLVMCTDTVLRAGPYINHSQNLLRAHSQGSMWVRSVKRGDVSVEGLTRCRVPKPSTLASGVHAPEDATQLLGLNASGGGQLATPLEDKHQWGLFRQIWNVFQLVDTSSQKKHLMVADHHHCLSLWVGLVAGTSFALSGWCRKSGHTFQARFLVALVCPVFLLVQGQLLGAGSRSVVSAPCLEFPAAALVFWVSRGLFCIRHTFQKFQRT